MKKELLEKLGMTEKEARLYFALLELGLCRAHALAKKINENRTTTYSLLASMQRKGMVIFLVKHNVKYFSAVDPKILIDHYFSDGQLLKSFLPELLAIHNRSSQKPKITFYEGVEGIKQICETLLEVPNSVRESFMGVDANTIHPEILRYFAEDFLPRRIEKNILYRGIVMGPMPMAKNFSKNLASHKREVKRVDSKLFPLKIHIDIFPVNKVALYSYNKDEMMGVIIEHESFFITMKTAFKLAWAGVDCFTEK
ncbi:hypothetical protein HYV57_03090 [Candidatus Peregrinibacteria bacterium]|nr:hypothetical protein [Candidatus Peregrinibacteria bacterium]